VILPVTGWRYAREMQQPARADAVHTEAALTPGRATTGTVVQRNIALPSTLTLRT
jgi:hypothetical protein